MKTLNHNEVATVSGGADPVTITITVIGMVVAAGYMIGKDLAERDNAMSCPAN